MNTDQIRYYAERAKEYEKIYERPERRKDLQNLARILKGFLAGKEILEIACGTGYWTQILSETSKSIYATDINETVLEIARSKNCHSPVQFALSDIYNLEPSGRHFDAAFGGFIWSHVPKQNLEDFLLGLFKCIKTGGTVVFVDNQYVEGSSTPINSIDGFGNSYQIRVLADGSNHLVLKNFPNDIELLEAVEKFDGQAEIIRLQYYWVLKIKLGSQGRNGA